MRPIANRVSIRWARPHRSSLQLFTKFARTRLLNSFEPSNASPAHREPRPQRRRVNRVPQPSETAHVLPRVSTPSPAPFVCEFAEGSQTAFFISDKTANGFFRSYCRVLPQSTGFESSSSSNARRSVGFRAFHSVFALLASSSIFDANTRYSPSMALCASASLSAVSFFSPWMRSLARRSYYPDTRSDA